MLKTKKSTKAKYQSSNKEIMEYLNKVKENIAESRFSFYILWSVTTAITF